MIDTAPSTQPTTIPSTMRAAALVAAAEFRIVTKPVPEPGPGEVLVKVAMCGTCGSDLRIQVLRRPGEPPFGNFTPGHEWTGTVVKLGPTVDEFAVGDRVAIQAHRGCGRCENCIVGAYTACLNYGDLDKGHRATGMTADGGFAEYVVHHVGALFKMPDNVTWEDAVLVMTAGTGLYGLDTVGGYIAGDTIVVFGAGPVGLMTVQSCKALGAERVILVDVKPSRLELGARLGADVVIDAQTEDPVEAARGAAGRRGIDLAIDAAGGPQTAQQCLELVRRDGKVLFLGFYKGPVTIDINRAITDDITFYATRGEGRRNVRRALSLVAQGKIRGKELVTHRFPLEEINEGFRMIREGEGDPVKVVFVP